jgi:hypothetical protein
MAQYWWVKMIMKNLLYIFLVVFFSTASAQDQVIANISSALDASSAKELIKYCGNKIEIKIDGNTNTYSKPQAEAVLRDFFQRNSSEQFEIIHQGSSPEGLKYAIGKYSMKQGSYRIVMFLKKGDSEYEIDRITFSKE